MIKAAGLLLATLAFTACQSTGVSYFHQMSAAELAAHNFGLPIEKQIICISRTTTSSRITRRRCNTRDYFASENVRNAGMVNATSAGTPIFRIP